MPLYDIYSHITYCLRPSDIETVMVNGKIVVENGKPSTMDEAEIMDKARIWQEKIKSS
jgi:5-methylthioadenosine/S-adenosylhomocysteine deaminase